MVLVPCQCFHLVLATLFLIVHYAEQITRPHDVEEHGRQSRSKTRALIPRAERSLLSPAPCPGDEPYCDAADDYPIEQVQQMLQQQPQSVLDHFFVEEEDESKIDRFEPDSKDVVEHELCPSKFRNLYPTKAQSLEDPTKYEFVVNTDKYKQAVRLEECVSSSKKCDIPGDLPNGYESYCVQKYIVRYLLVLNGTGSKFDGFITKPYEFPSCCTCQMFMNISVVSGSHSSSCSCC